MLVTVACLAATFSAPALAQEASSAVYVRADSDHTTIVSPRLRLAGAVEETTSVDLIYSVDVWTSASVDITTSASKSVTEQRDEIDAAVRHELPLGSMHAGYRYSTEPDYHSHGVSLGGSLDLAGKATTIGATFDAKADRVLRAGDPAFDRRLRILALRAREWAREARLTS